MAISVVVTGASGFIGSSLVKSLKLDLDIEAIPVSRSGIDGSHIRVNDYRDTPAGNVLVHLAENPNRLAVNKSGEDYIKEAEVSLEAIIAKGYSRIIYCSSAVVYGDAGNIPYTEEFPISRFDNYTRMKLNNEEKVIGSGGIAVRLANVVGPGMAKNNVLSEIIYQLPNTGPLYVNNEKPIRDFIWLGDVVKALVKLIREGREGVYNVGTGVGFSIGELAQTALKVAGKNNTGVRSLALSSRASYNVVNIGKMRSVCGWSPQLTLEQSIEHLVSEM